MQPDEETGSAEEQPASNMVASILFANGAVFCGDSFCNQTGLPAKKTYTFGQGSSICPK